MAGLNSKSVLDALESRVSSTGFFRQVNTHEPKSAPDTHLNAAIFSSRIVPYAQGSGLQATSANVVFTIRLYYGMLNEPQDLIDTSLMVAVDAIFNNFHGDYDLGLATIVRNMDLLGETGVQLEANFGYVTVDNTMYRGCDITVPIIINDVWTQTA